MKGNKNKVEGERAKGGTSEWGPAAAVFPLAREPNSGFIKT